MSRQGFVFKRCGRCSGRVSGRRCGCGYGEASWTFIVDIHQKGQKRKTKMKGGFAKRSEAVSALQAELIAREAGTYVEPRKLTVGEYLASWLPAIRREVRPGTVVNYEHTVRVVSERIGPVLLQQLTRQEVKTLYGELGASKAPKTIHNHHLILHEPCAMRSRTGSSPAIRPTERTGCHPVAAMR